MTEQIDFSLASTPGLAGTYYRMLKKYGLSGPDWQQPINQVYQNRLGYAPTYWEDPRRVARYHNLVKSMEPKGWVAPDWLDTKALGAAYDYLEFSNDGKPWYEWKPLGVDDPGRSILQGLQQPPDEYLWPDEQQFISGQPYQVAGQEQIETPGMSGMTPEEWAEVPLSQRLMLALSESPVLSTAQMAAGGFAVGSFLAGPAGALALGLGGVGAGLYSYYRQKWFPEGAEEDPILRALNWMDLPFQGAKQIWGTAGQIGASILDPEKYGSVSEVLNSLEAARKASYLTTVAAPPELQAAMQVGSVLIGGKVFGRNVVKSGIAAGVSPWMVEATAHLENEFRALADVSNALGWTAIQIPTAEAVEDLPPGYVWHLGVAQPVYIGREGVAGWAQTLAEARQAIAANPDMAPEIISEYAAMYGFQGQFNELLGGFFMDPLDYVGDITKAGGIAYAKVAGKPLLAEALGASHGLIDGMGGYGILLRVNWDGQAPPSKLAQMSGLERWLAGVTKEGTPVEWNPPKNRLEYLFKLTPAARASEILNSSAVNIGFLLERAGDDPALMINYMNRLRSTPADLAAQLSMPVFDSVDGASIIHALNDSDVNIKGKMDELMLQWTETADQRLLMQNIGRVMGVDPEEVLRQISSSKDVGNLLKSYVDKARQNPGAPGAAEIVRAFDTQQLTPAALTELVSSFIENGIPHNTDMFRADLYHAVMSGMDQWAAKFFDVKPDATWAQVGNLIKSAQSVVLLGLNPAFLINNTLNNMVVSAASGVFGMRTMKQIEEFWTAMGIKPPRLRAGVGPAAIGLDLSYDAIRRAASNTGTLADMQAFLRSTSDKFGIFSNLSQANEQFSSAQAFTQGTKNALNKLLRPGVGFDRLPPALERALVQIDRRLPGLVYAAIQSGLNQKAIEQTLFSGMARVTLDSVIPEVSRRLGESETDIRNLLTDSGVYDELSKRLVDAKNDDDVRSAFIYADDKVRDWLNERLASRLSREAEQAAASVQAEGTIAVLPIWNKLQLMIAKNWQKHFLEWEDTFARIETLEDPGHRTALIKAQKRAAAFRWDQIWRTQIAAYKGILDGLGIDSHNARLIGTLLSDNELNWKQFYSTVDEKMNSFFDTTFENREARGTAWERLQDELQELYSAAADREVSLQRDLDASFVDGLRQKWPNKVAQAEAWRARMLEYYTGRADKMTRHREYIRNLRASERRGEWSRFIRQEYLPYIFEFLTEQIRGAEALYGRGVDDPDFANRPPEGEGPGPAPEGEQPGPAPEEGGPQPEQPGPQMPEIEPPAQPSTPEQPPATPVELPPARLTDEQVARVREYYDIAGQYQNVAVDSDGAIVPSHMLRILRKAEYGGSDTYTMTMLQNGEIDPADVRRIFQNRETIKNAAQRVQEGQYEGPERRLDAAYREEIDRLRAQVETLRTDQTTNMRVWLTERNTVPEGSYRFFGSMDVSGLKILNDLYGHDSGDLLIKTIGEIVNKNGLRDKVYRRGSQGSDEFVMIGDDQAEIEQTFNYIKRQLKDAIIIVEQGENIYLLSGFEAEFGIAEQTGGLDHGRINDLADEQLNARKADAKREWYAPEWAPKGTGGEDRYFIPADFRRYEITPDEWGTLDRRNITIGPEAFYFRDHIKARIDAEIEAGTPRVEIPDNINETDMGPASWLIENLEYGTHLVESIKDTARQMYTDIGTVEKTHRAADDISATLKESDLDTLSVSTHGQWYRELTNPDFGVVTKETAYQRSSIEGALDRILFPEKVVTYPDGTTRTYRNRDKIGKRDFTLFKIKEILYEKMGQFTFSRGEQIPPPPGLLLFYHEDPAGALEAFRFIYDQNIRMGLPIDDDYTIKACWGQEGFDRLVTMLMDEQDAISSAANADEAIRNLDGTAEVEEPAPPKTYQAPEVAEITEQTHRVINELMKRDDLLAKYNEWKDTVERPHQISAGDVRQSLYDSAIRIFSYTPEQATRIVELTDARARVWAKLYKVNPSEWYRKHLAGFVHGDPGSVGLDQPIDTRMLAIHNLTASNLMMIDDLGGMPNPSLAVITPDLPLTNFGDITLIGNRNLVDPYRGARTFDSDIYSARVPSPEYKPAKRADYYAFMAKIKKLVPEIEQIKFTNQSGYVYWSFQAIDWLLEEALFDRPSLSNVVGTIEKTDAFRIAYLREKGVEISDEQFNQLLQIQYRNENRSWLYDAVPEGDYEFHQWAVRQAKSLIKDSAQVRVRGKLVPYTPENVVEAMRTGRSIKAQEETMTYGPGKARAAGSQEFRSVEEMRAATTRMGTADELKMHETTVQDPLREKLADEIITHYRYYREGEMNWDYLDYLHKAMGSYLGRVKTRSYAQMESALYRNDFINLNEDIINMAMDYADSIRNAPVPYYESKPERVVALSEFSGAVIPDDASPNVIKILDRHKIPYVTYKSHDSLDRIAKMQEFFDKPDVLFQDESPVFYSQLKRVVSAAQKEEFTVAELEGWLKKGGVRADELYWSGLESFLRGAESDRMITKAGLSSMLNQWANYQIIEKRWSNTEFETGIKYDRYREIEDYQTAYRQSVYLNEIATEQLYQEYIKHVPLLQLKDVPDINLRYDEPVSGGGNPTLDYFYSIILSGEGPGYEWLLSKKTDIETLKHHYALAEQIYEGNLARSTRPQVEPYKKESKWERYTLSGKKEKYTEIQFVVKNAYQDMVQRELFGTVKKPDYARGHWDENADWTLAHVRFDERIDADGKRTLHLEEVQSDWLQMGRKRGFFDPSETMPEGWEYAALRNGKFALWADHQYFSVPEYLVGPLEKARYLHVRSGEPISKDGYTYRRVLEFETIEHAKNFANIIMEKKPILPNGWELRWAEMGDFHGWTIVDQHGKVVPTGLPPDPDSRYALLKAIIAADHKGEMHKFYDVMPSVLSKTWPEFVMKRMLRYAAENGYDRLSWSTGAQQTRMWTDSTRAIVDDIYLTVHLAETPTQYMLKGYKNGREVISRVVVRSDLPDLVGDDVSAKLLEGVDVDTPYKVGRVTGDDIVVGGRGFIGFYDEMLPSFVNKYTKKWGGKVTEGKIEIAPEMRPTFYVELPDYRPTDPDARYIVFEEYGNVFVQNRYGNDELVFSGDTYGEALEWLDYHAPGEGVEFRKWLDENGYKEQKAAVETIHSLEITDEMVNSVMKGQPLFQKTRGAVHFLADGRAMIYAMNSPNISTLVHEIGHVFRRDLYNTAADHPALQNDIRLTENWLKLEVERLNDLARRGKLTRPQRTRIFGQEEQISAFLQDGNWTRAAEEIWASAFERYLAEGIAPSTGLRRVFESFKKWILSVYTSIVGSGIEVNLNDDVRRVFDRLLVEESGNTPEVGEAPIGKTEDGQTTLFGAGEESPLISGVAGNVESETFVPKVEEKQDLLPGMEDVYRPQMKGAKSGEGVEYHTNYNARTAKFTVRLDVNPPQAVLDVLKSFGAEPTDALRLDWKIDDLEYTDYVIMMNAIKAAYQPEIELPTRQQPETPIEPIVTAPKEEINGYVYFKDQGGNLRRYRVGASPNSSRLEAPAHLADERLRMLREQVANLPEPHIWELNTDEFGTIRGKYQESPDSQLYEWFISEATGKKQLTVYTVGRNPKDEPGIKDRIQNYIDRTISEQPDMPPVDVEAEPGRRLVDWTKPITDKEYWSTVVSEIIGTEGEIDKLSIIQQWLERDITEEPGEMYYQRVEGESTWEEILRLAAVKKTADETQRADIVTRLSGNNAPKVRTHGQRPSNQPQGGISNRPTVERPPAGGPESINPNELPGDLGGPDSANVWGEPKGRGAADTGNIDPHADQPPAAPAPKPSRQRPRIDTISNDIKRIVGDTEFPEPHIDLQNERVLSILDENAGQVTDTRRILSAFERGNRAYVLANKTGTGKTFVGLATILEMQPKNTLIVVPGPNIAHDWIVTGKKFFDYKITNESLPSGEGAWITTYSNLSRNGRNIIDHPWDLIIFDESHKLKRVGTSKQANWGTSIVDHNPDAKVLFSSATPFQSVKEMEYLGSLGLWEGKAGFERYLANHGYVWKDTSVGGYWNFVGTVDDLLDVFKTMYSRGLMSQRELMMDAQLTNRFVRVRLDPRLNAIYNEVMHLFDQALGTVYNPLLTGVINAQRTIAQRRIMEIHKIDTAAKLAKEMEALGRQVAIFVGYKGELSPPDFKSPKLQRARYILQDIYSKLDATEGKSVENLIRELGGPDKVAQVDGSVTPARRTAEIEAYNTGQKKFIVATAASGGTGLSLHDKLGGAPRAQINAYLPWSGQEFYQVAGRSYRYGSKNDVIQVWLFADTFKEASIANVVGSRLKEMNALVSGIHADADSTKISEFDFGLLDVPDNGPDSTAPDKLFQIYELSDEQFANYLRAVARQAAGREPLRERARFVKNIILEETIPERKAAIWRVVSRAAPDVANYLATPWQYGKGGASRILYQNDDGPVVQRGTGDNEQVPLFGQDPESVTEVPPGTVEGLQPTPPIEEIELEGYDDFARPVLAELQDSMTGNKAMLPKMANLPKDLDPAQMKDLKRYLGKVYGQLAQTKLAATKMGELRRDQALLNYGRRRGFDNILQLGFPYQFWYTRQALQWAMRVLDRPSWLSNYGRIRRFQKYANQDKGFPSRLRNKMRIPMPFLPGWMGGGMYVDPIRQFFPFENFFRPMQQLAEQDNQQQRRAESLVSEWLQDEEITQNEAQLALTTRSGAIWQKALTQARTEVEGEINNPLDFANLMVGMSLPLSYAYYGVTGQSDRISQLPVTRLVQGVSALAGANKGRGWNIEGPIRRGLGMPERGQYDDYRVDRMLANMAAEGLITSDDAQRAMIDRSGQAFEQAEARVAKMGGVSVFGSPIGADFFPEGEQTQRALKNEYDKARDAGKLTDFFDKYPEYEARMMMFKEDPEERLRTYLISSIWDGYLALPELTKRQLREQLGDEFDQKFLTKATRSYDDINTPTLTAWSKVVGQEPPTAAPEVPELPLDLAPPEVTQQYQEYINEKERLFPTIGSLLQVYYILSDDDKNKYSKKYPEIDAYNKWRTKYLADHPDIIPYAISEDNKVANAKPEIQSLYYQYQAARDQQFPGVFDLQDKYYSLPAGDQRRNFLAANPMLQAYWEWRRAFMGQFPQMIPYLMSTESLAEAVLGGSGGSGGYSSAPKKPKEDAPYLTYSEMNQYSPPLISQLYAYYYRNEPLGSGALKELRRLWETSGRTKPFDYYLDVVVRPSFVR